MITNSDACILTFVVLYNFAVEMEILSQLLSELNLNGEGYEEVSAQRRLMFDEMDMERDDTSSLGCATLSDYNDESLEGQLQETEDEGVEEEKRRPEREDDDAPCHKRRRVVNGE